MTSLVKPPSTPSPTPQLTIVSEGNNDQKATAFSPPVSRSGSAPNTPASESSSPTSCNGGNGKYIFTHWNGLFYSKYKH